MSKIITTFVIVVMKLEKNDGSKKIIITKIMQRDAIMSATKILIKLLFSDLPRTVISQCNYLTGAGRFCMKTSI